jgi:hypothetical protein
MTITVKVDREEIMEAIIEVVMIEEEMRAVEAIEDVTTMEVTDVEVMEIKDVMNAEEAIAPEAAAMTIKVVADKEVAHPAAE